MNSTNPSNYEENNLNSQTGHMRLFVNPTKLLQSTVSNKRWNKFVSNSTNRSQLLFLYNNYIKHFNPVNNKISFEEFCAFAKDNTQL